MSNLLQICAKKNTAILLLLLNLLHVAFADPVTVVTVSAPKPTNEPSYVFNADFVASVLNSTNFYRYEHGVDPLAWNNSLEEYAHNWIQSCDFKHSGGPPGENLAEGYANTTAAIEAWGDERAQYDFASPGFAEATGHFTQLVWRATRTVGCARKFCSSGVGGWYVACEYWPAGNVVGAFAAQVPARANDGAAYVFQNCTITNNCTVDGGTPGASGDGDGDGDEDGDGNDASRLVVGPLMAFIVVLATGLGLWEPLQIMYQN